MLGMAVSATLVTTGAAQAQEVSEKAPVAPRIFQAAGPDAASIQGAVDAFRAALGQPNNGNDPGPLADGRREINWDGGGGIDTTTPPVTPFDVFLNSRGSQFTTPGVGLTQAPPSGGPEGGLAGLANNASYGTAFATFSPLRLFAPVGSNITNARFFVPGTSGAVPATVRGFGSVFADVDQLDGRPQNPNRNSIKPSTRIQYFDANGRLLRANFVPAAPGNGGLAFFGIVFDDARIAHVRIKTGDRALGLNDNRKHDIVVMDDFIYGEPQMIH
jgi:hypothetical protein